MLNKYYSIILSELKNILREINLVEIYEIVELVNTNEIRIDVNNDINYILISPYKYDDYYGISEWYVNINYSDIYKEKNRC